MLGINLCSRVGPRPKKVFRANKLADVLIAGRGIVRVLGSGFAGISKMLIGKM